MAVTQYIGARYVPLFAEPLTWDVTKEYEPLTIVYYQGNSYTSKQAVPAGIELSNENFWAITGNYNAQVEQYRQEVRTYDGRITSNATAIANETTARESADTAINSAIDSEATTRASADTALGDAITAEATARANADTAIEDSIGSGFDSTHTVADAIAAEATARANADTAIEDSIGSGFDSTHTVADTISDEAAARADSDAEIESIIGTGFDDVNTIKATIGNDFDASYSISDAISALKNSAVGGYTLSPQYLGCFTAFNGLWQSAATANSKPYPAYQQGYCIGKNNEHKFLYRNADSTLCKVATANTVTNTLVHSNSSYSFGHGNQMEYDPDNDHYFINTGSGFIVTDSNFNQIGSFAIPDGNGYGFICYDKKTHKWWLVSYNAYVYEFDPVTYNMQQLGYQMDVLPDYAGSGAMQGGAVYNNILILPFGKGDRSLVGLFALDITTGEEICRFAVPRYGEVLPFGEPEDCSFDADGNLYVATAMRANTSNDYCSTTALYMMNIFTGNLNIHGGYYSEVPQNVYVECSNYSGFYSDGTNNYPFKSLHELSLYLTCNDVRNVKMGLESNYSSSAAQTWFGIVEANGKNLTLHHNGSNNITVRGRYIFRSCVVSLRNRTNFTRWYDTATNSTFMHCEDCIINTAGIYVVTASGSGLVGLAGTIALQGSGSAHFVYVGEETGVAKFAGQYNGGDGTYIGNAHTWS